MSNRKHQRILKDSEQVIPALKLTLSDPWVVAIVSEGPRSDCHC